MEVKLRADKSIEIIAESVVEAFALNYLCPLSSVPCPNCGQFKFPIIINVGVLMGGCGDISTKLYREDMNEKKKG